MSIYRAEEKRIKLLYGSRQGLKYKIKLNDQILDPGQASQSPQSKGQIKLGKTVEPNQLMQINIKKMNEKKEKDDIFGTQQKLHLGPGDYEVKVDAVKNQSPSLQFVSKASQKQPDPVKVGENQYKQIRLFDGSASTIKKITKPIMCAPLEERQIVFNITDEKGSKAESVFNSKTDRFKGNKTNNYLNMVNNPGPQDYNLE